MNQFTLNNDKLDEAINKTGFPTEYKVQQILASHGWKVVSNRYYIDDQKGIEREIDLLAEKDRVKLIISCKKSSEEFWTFMTSNNKDIDVPLECTIKDKILGYFIDHERNTFDSTVSLYPGLSELFDAPDLVRAFQQIRIQDYKPNNDKQIYDSIITTIKAADYEETHSHGRSVYFMLSVFDGEIFQKDFDTGDIKNIDEIKYVNRHFIGDNDRYYCVHFTKYDAFETILSYYDNVVIELPKFITDLNEEFKKDVFNYQDRIDLLRRNLEDDFFKGLGDQSENIEVDVYSLSNNPTDIRFSFSKSGKLHLSLDLSFFSHRAAFAKEINDDKCCHKLMAQLLEKYYGYTGPFVIENDQEKEAKYDNGFVE